MQRRVLVAAIALICAIPAAANAQLMPLQDDPSFGSRLRITPFLGYMPSVVRHETWVHSNDTDETTFVDVDAHLGSGSAIGVNGEYALRGPWSALGTLMYGSRGDRSFDLVNTGSEFAINASRYIVARGGVSYTLKEKETELTMRRVSATVFGGPFYMREIPRSESGFEDLDVFGASNNFGLSVGAAGEIPFNKDRMSFQLGVEDYATWWNSGGLRRLPDSLIEDDTPGASTRVESSVSHMWVIRAGVSWRWR
jgi:hypothetical protein